MALSLFTNIIFCPFFSGLSRVGNPCCHVSTCRCVDTLGHFRSFINDPKDFYPWCTVQIKNRNKCCLLDWRFGLLDLLHTHGEVLAYISCCYKLDRPLRTLIASMLFSTFTLWRGPYTTTLGLKWRTNSESSPLKCFVVSSN